MFCLIFVESQVQIVRITNYRGLALLLRDHQLILDSNALYLRLEVGGLVLGEVN